MSTASPDGPSNGGSAVSSPASQPPSASPSPRPRIGPAMFLFGTTLGEGAYARVMHAKHKDTGQEFAVKVMEKAFIKKEDKVRFVLQERNVVSSLRHPSVVRLFYTFQDAEYLFLALELCTGGELLHLVRQRATQNAGAGQLDRALSVEEARYYAAAVLHALEYVHGKGIVHRDLKPENVLLDRDGRVKLADFGTCKCMDSGDGEHNAFVGTAEYVSPEVLRDEEAGFASDLWALGCLVFQLLVGRPPFRADSEFLMFQTILEHPGNGALSFPDSVPPEARDLVNALLVQDPAERLGGGPSPRDVDHGALKSHPFFDGVDWDGLLEREPPAQPPRQQLPPCTIDGANPDWLLEDVATELDEAQFHTSTEVQRVLAKGSAQPTPELARETELWTAFLRASETVLLCGTVSKRKGLFSKTRRLLLTDAPRLMYLDVGERKLKGHVPWSQIKHVEAFGSEKFDVVIPGRAYHFKVLDGPTAEEWRDRIRAVLGL